MIVRPDDLILITGSTGFIGSRVVEFLLRLGFRNIRCFARPSSDTTKIDAVSGAFSGARVSLFLGNLLSVEDCLAATQGAAVIFHLAAAVSVDSFPEAYKNSVVTTRNLLEAAHRLGVLRRFVNISSFSVYSNQHKPQGRVLDESCPVETNPELRGDPYSFAKVKQDALVVESCEKYDIPYILIRPGCVYGPGKDPMNGMVGTGTFGLFLHLGGSNRIPFTYVDNCAEAIVLAGLKEGVDGETFNVVDDDLPTSRKFLRFYKHNIKNFKSVYVPHSLSYSLCYLWEWYSGWSEGQLPAAFNRKRWHTYWKKTAYSNTRLKTRVGWLPRVPIDEGLRRCAEISQERENRA